MKIIMLVGLPGSGKSTYAKHIKNENTITISSDEIREELLDNVNDQTNNTLVFETVNNRVIEHLQKKDFSTIIVDATNLSRKYRMNFLNRIKKFNVEKQCMVIAAPYEDCLDNNKSRERVVPEEVMRKMYLRFEIPQYFEGWDAIDFELKYDREMYDLSGSFCDNLNISQDNKYHTKTIKDHCFECFRYLQDRNYAKVLRVAGYCHDFGKVFTKKFENYKGEKTEDAHYYHHENVSTYLAMFIIDYNFGSFTKDEYLLILGLIQYHMRPHHLKTEKSIAKFVNMVGEKFWKGLLILNEADNDAR